MPLDKIPHRHKARKAAFLFNCFVPVRPGDLAALTEANIRPGSNGGFDVYFRLGKKNRGCAGGEADTPGVLPHVMVLGIEQMAIVVDEGDREDFPERLGRAVAATGTTICYAS